MVLSRKQNSLLLEEVVEGNLFIEQSIIILSAVRLYEEWADLRLYIAFIDKQKTCVRVFLCSYQRR